MSNKEIIEEKEVVLAGEKIIVSIRKEEINNYYHGKFVRFIPYARFKEKLTGNLIVNRLRKKYG